MILDLLDNKMRNNLNEATLTFFIKFESTLKNGLFSIDRYLLEIQNSILSVIVGIWFLTYLSIIDLIPDSFLYLAYIPLYVWGIIYLVFGIIHILCLFTGFRRIRKQIMLVNSGLWAFLSIQLLLANPYSLIGYWTIIFMIMTFIAFLRVQILHSDK